jgi:8-oxo-dGTP diphosphatase
MTNSINRPNTAVALLVFNEQGKILLGKRTGKRDTGQWGTPGGGIEHNESIEDAAARELFEEAGAIPLANPKTIGCTNTLCDTTPWFTTFVACQIDRTPRNCEPDKCAGWEWFNWDNLPQPLLHSIELLIEQIGLEALKQATSIAPLPSTKELKKQI